MPINTHQSTAESLLRRAELYLEDKEWQNAVEYYESVLDAEPENAYAYVGLLLAEKHITSENELITLKDMFKGNKYYQKAVRFADEEYKEKLIYYSNENIYVQACALLNTAKDSAAYKRAMELLAEIADYKDAHQKAEHCETRIKNLELEEKYQEAASLQATNDIDNIRKAMVMFKNIAYADAAERAVQCENKISKIASEKEKANKARQVKIIAAIVAVFAVIITVTCVRNAQNKARAEMIYQNFLGKTFDGSEEDDDGFFSDYQSNNLQEYKVYYNTTEEKSLTFREDGSVYYNSVHDTTVLAYPASSSKPDGYHNEYDGTYDSFSVRVTFSGDVYVKVGSREFEVYVGSNNIPQTIFDYEGVTLR